MPDHPRRSGDGNSRRPTRGQRLLPTRRP
jgi:hypothetical protein